MMTSTTQTKPNYLSCMDCPIRHRAVCAQCEAEELASLDAIKYYRSYDAGQPLIWAGDEMDFVASVVFGTATLSQRLEDGRTQMVGLLMPSDFLGRPGRVLATHDVTANSDLTLCCFRRKPFEKLLKSTPQIGARLLEMTLDELDAARQWLMILGRKSAREKIASLLAIIAQRSAALEQKLPHDGMTLDLPLTREAMADYLGVTLETVSRQMSALKRDGLILLHGKRRVDIPDYSRLLDETGEADAEV